MSVAGDDEDPYLWLEDIAGERALAWVRARNAEADAQLAADPGFEPLRSDLRAILDSSARIPYVEKIGDYYYNFWRDELNPAGLWRRTTPEQYRHREPDWDVLLDLDALNRAEDENWVWHGADCLRPDYRRALIALSRGGADADVSREFDLVDRAWVADGFYRPEAKGSLGWKDRDTVFVSSDFGPGSLTDSGYARLVKLWRRGTPLAQARLVYAGLASDIGVGGYRDHTPGYERDFLTRALSFYTDELYVLDADGEARKIDAPDSASKYVFRDLLAVELREPWTVAGQTHDAGSLLTAPLDDYLAGKRELQVAFAPDAQTSLAGFGATRDYWFLNVLEDVKNRLYVLTPGAAGWTREPLAGAPAMGTVAIEAVDAEASNHYFLTSTDYLTPTTLWLGEIGHEPERLKQLPAFFEAGELEFAQHFATSDDGTRVPYFLVASSGLARDGSHPTLLTGYGGFEIALTPAYSAAVGRAWLARGGVYVVANIRGGGEYGPRWHQAALKARRHKSFEDFAAVAEDLVARRITVPARLGIQGGSNGGLLVANLLVRAPQRVGAVVCQVPLLDLRRYHRLLAGASWIDEYGDPDRPEEWAFLRANSPYHQVSAEAVYPPVLFTTSTRDDRVHPGHARKMMARMLEQGHDVSYYENIEGGHGGGANNAQAAFMQALSYIFLWQRLTRDGS